MTPDAPPSNRTYRPAVRGLVFGLLAVAARAATIGFVLFAFSGYEGDRSKQLFVVMELLPVFNLVATAIALIGVGYSAIAAHRKEWGLVLVLAWLASVLAVLFDVEPFYYATL